MRGFETYKKLKFWIELLEEEIAILKIKISQTEKRLGTRLKGYSSPQYSHTKVDLKYKDPYPSETAYKYYLQLKKEIKARQYELKKLKARERKIKKLFKTMGTTKYKVAYLREIEGLSLYEIASDLGYSESYIKKVSMEVSRELEGCADG